tara:strand:+ start:4166 stop:5047 length:882 start_codon:yes stop_codon:yes gene_type:complete
MPVPSSGQLRLRADINQEVNGNNTDDNVSLGALSNEAGFTEPDNMSEFYGYTACVAPSVTTNTSTSVGSGNFYANGNLTNLGGAGCNQTDHGFYVGTNSSSPTNNTQHSLGARTSTGSFNKNITGLSSNTTYYVWAYSTNAVGTSYGSRVTTTTALPGISIYLAGNWTANPINNKQACGGSASGIWSFNGDCTAPYGNCYSCPVIGWSTITGSGCEVSTNYGSSWVAMPTIQSTAGSGDPFTGTVRWNHTTRWNTAGITNVKCTTCSPGWYRYLSKSGYQDRNLGTATLSWTS